MAALGQLPVVALADAPERQVWRVKPADELEPVITFCEARVRLRSVQRPSLEASLEFLNTAGRPVRVLWLDWDGNEVPYSTLKPGERRRYRTYSGHAWTLRSLDTQARMCLNGAQAVVATRQLQTVVVTEPPALAWSEASHAAFPEEFRAEAAALLRCHHRCEGTSSGGGGGGAAAAHLGLLPRDVLSLVIRKLAPALAQDSSVRGHHPDIQPTPLLELPTAFGLLLPMPGPIFAAPGAAALPPPPGLAQAAA